ncbi:MAG: substrate-binding domain-containing protein [Burkholderiaceae bacterium]
MLHQAKAFAILALAVSGFAGSVHAQAVINVYGPGGPAPAMQEAAKAFGATNKVTVNVAAGPTPQWVEKAKQDADVIFSGAENMFTDFAKVLPGAFELKDAYPLYLRPAAILVRPGNPKNIRGFRDLLAPNVKVLTVAGAGQIGVWEDVAGRTGDIAMVRAFRKNMVFPEAANSGAAKEQWTQQKDIDAWLIWNIWQVANPDLAQVVELDEPFRIYRDAGVVLTRKGQAEPQAAAFVEFLKSPAGQKIFAKWGWDARPVAAVGGARPVTTMGASEQASFGRRFARLDKNRDGLLTWEEVAPSRARDFDTMDKNNDRRITNAEFRGQQPFGSFDINQDGAVSKAEFLATHRSMFMQFDADANQRISMSEFATAQRAAATQAMPR